MKLWNQLKNKLKCTRSCKCFRCKLVKLVKNWYKAVKSISKKAYDSFKELVRGSGMADTQLLKPLVALGGGVWLVLTGSLECTFSLLLFGWGAAELIDWWAWK